MSYLDGSIRALLSAWLVALALPSHLAATGPCNQAPSATADLAGGTVDWPLVLDPLANDSDPEGQPLAIVVSSHDCPLGQLVADPAGTLTYTPPPGFAGSCAVLYRASDSEGAMSPQATISITISESTAVFFGDFEAGDFSNWTSLESERVDE